MHMRCTSRLICNSLEVVAYDSKDWHGLRVYHVSEDVLPFLVKMNTDSHWIKCAQFCGCHVVDIHGIFVDGLDVVQ